MKDARKESEIPKRSVVGKIIAQIWGTSVVKCKTSSTKYGCAGYKNLGLRFIPPNIKDEITDFDEKTVNAIQQICDKNEGYIINDLCRDKGIICLLKAPYCNQGGKDTGVTVDNRRVVMELTINVRPTVGMALQTHSKPVPVADIFGSFQNDILVSLHSICSILRLLNSTALCLGGEIPADHNEAQDSELQQPVLCSRLARVSKDNVVVDHLISSSCLLVMPIGTTACDHCVYAKRLYRNRADKRKRAEHIEKIASKRNDRYLNRSGLENKISLQKKQRPTNKPTEKVEDEMLTFVESDHNDLLQILEKVDNSKIPEDMKLLWNMQVQQLTTKTPKGYHWDPRLVT